MVKSASLSLVVMLLMCWQSFSQIVIDVEYTKFTQFDIICQENILATVLFNNDTLKYSYSIYNGIFPETMMVSDERSTIKGRNYYSHHPNSFQTTKIRKSTYHIRKLKIDVWEEIPFSYNIHQLIQKKLQ